MVKQYYVSKYENALFLFFLIFLVWLPIPLGSNRLWATAIMEIGAFLLFLWLIVLIERGIIVIPQHVRKLKWLLVLMIFSLLYALFQLVELPMDIFKTISPIHADINNEALILEQVDGLSISVDHYKTYSYILKLLAYYAIFWISIILANTNKRVFYLLLAIALGGTVQAVFSIAGALGDWYTSINTGSKVFSGIISGSFVNYNHFAAFLNMSIVALIGLIFLTRMEISPRHLQARARAKTPLWQIHFSIYFAVLIAAMIMTHSRGGAIALLLAFAGSFLLIASNSVYRVRYLSAFNGLWVIAFLVVLWAGYGFFIAQFDNASNDYSIRLHILHLSWQVIKDFWLLGVGAGNYAALIPLYETSSFGFYIDHAHNDYIELLVEQGVIGFLIYFIMILIAMVYSIKTIRHIDSVSYKTYALIGLMGCMTMLFHSLIDFNFQIPSNAAYFFIFLALALLRPAHYGLNWKI